MAKDDRRFLNNKSMFSHNIRSLFINDNNEVSFCEILWYDFDKTTSTMDYAVRMTKEGCDPWTIVSANEQISGRGTQGRTWFSPGGKGLWISVVLPPPLKAEYLSNLSILAAQALIQSFKEFTELKFEIKHPNDVTINGRKIAGILLESSTIDTKVLFVVIGMGVNFQQSIKDFEREGLSDATSFLIETGSVPDREQLIKSFLRNFKPMYEKKMLEDGDINI